MNLSGVFDKFSIMGLESFIPFLLVFLVFYWLVIRPQNQKIYEQKKMIAGLKKGDNVSTSSGIIGKIAKLDGNDYVLLEIDEGVKVKFSKEMITGLIK